MGRGKFSADEIEQLKNNPYVIDVNETRIVYSNEFKKHFMKEYKKGIKPTEIFRAAGFDPEILGSKRIERASARWREADLNGTLGQHGYIQLEAKKKRTDALKSKDEKISRQRDKYEEKLDKKEKQLDRQHDAYEKKLDKKEQENLKKLRAKQAEIEKLKAENELLKKVGKLGGRRCEKKVYGKIDLYYLVKETVDKYGLHGEISRLCKAVGLPRSDYYYYESTAEKRALREEKDEEYAYFVKKAFNSCKYKKQGSRSVGMVLRREYDINYNRKKIQRIMRKFDIICPIKTSNPYKKIWKATKEDKVAPNLVKRNFKTGEARKLFLTDITYIKHQNHFSYVSVIIDAQTTEPIAHMTSTSLRMDFVMESLKQLEECGYAEGAIIHSDQGVHYTSKEFRTKIKEMGLKQSMSRRGNCLDNSAMESFFGHMKQEMEFDPDATDAEIEKAVDEYIEDYRYHRYQEGLNEMTPYEYGCSLLAA